MKNETSERSDAKKYTIPGIWLITTLQPSTESAYRARALSDVVGTLATALTTPARLDHWWWARPKR